MTRLANPNLDDIDPDLNHFNVLYPDLVTRQGSEYYTYEKFKELASPLTTKFTLIHYNIRSLIPKIDEIGAELCHLELEFDVLAFTECWLDENTCNSVNFDNYVHIHSLRKNKRGGGISVFVRDKFTTKLLTNFNLCCEFVETLFVEISFGGASFLLCVIYRPPQGDNYLFNQKFDEIFSSLRVSKYNNIIVCGDFNYNLLQLDENINLSFLSLIRSHSLLPMISKPTRITDVSATLIDNIFVTCASNCHSGSVVSTLSDHFPIFLLIDSILVDNAPNHSVNIRLRHVNEDSVGQLCASLENCDFGDIVNSSDVSVSMELLHGTIDAHYNRYCPIKSKTISVRSFNKPWIRGDILDNVKKRQNMYILFKQRKIGKVAFNRFKNFVTQQIRASKRNYYFQKFEDFKSDVRQSWKFINSVLGRRRLVGERNINLVVGDVVLTDECCVANTFNNFFSQIGKNISDSIPDNIHEPSTFMTGNYINSFMFSEILPSDVDCTIRSLCNKKVNVNSIPVNIIKRISYIISPVLASIFNRSVLHGIFPDSLKIARVIPLHKGGSKADVNNYRPISILPIFAKIFEKIIYKKMYKFLVKYSILSNAQHGFRSGRSTVQATLTFLKYIYDNLDSDKVVFSAFLDFSKAFDSVDHRILLYKLHYYGFRGPIYEWLKSYLFNRYQYVNLGNSSSDYSIISHGVPQGSVLGPLLFLIFINDFPSCSDVFNFTLFADDSTISYGFDPISVPNVSNILNDELCRINNWISTNKIKINVNKTKYMLFTCRKTVSLSAILIGGEEVFRVNKIKFLGIHLDENLNFSCHAQNVLMKVSKSLGIINKMKFFLPDFILKSLYTTLIKPYFSYGIEVWYNAPNYSIEKIFRIQKASIRTICNLPFNSHTSCAFKDMSLLKLKDLFFFELCKRIFKAIHFGIDRNLFNNLPTHSNFHSYATRHSRDIVAPFYRKSKTQSCISFVGIKTWNSLPDNIKQLSSFISFKTLLFNYLVNQY